VRDRLASAVESLKTVGSGGTFLANSAVGLELAGVQPMERTADGVEELVRLNRKMLTVQQDGGGVELT
jgi:hypothetical protein